MGFEELDNLLFHSIASKLDPKDVAVLTCISKRVRVLASNDIIWRNFCSQDLDLSSPEDPDGNPTSSFKAAYQIWRKAFSMYSWSLVMRVKNCLGSLRSWLMMNISEAVRTLRKGASEADIKEVEDRLRVKLPLSTRVLYRLCDGQDISIKKSSRIEPENGFGVIGGYSFSNRIVNVCLLSLSEVSRATKEFVRQLGFSSTSKYIIVASSSTQNGKLFFQNCASGQLYVGTKNLSTVGEMMPCVPCELIGSRRDCKQDGMLLWLEEHSRRLHSGMIHVSVDGNMRSINLFPKSPPFCSTAVTHGVQIHASSVFVPELSDLQVEYEMHSYFYQMRVSLHRERCVLRGTPFDSCQLEGVHWDILVNDLVLLDVTLREPNLEGEYLVMLADGREIIYEHCAFLPAGFPAYAEGYFTLIPKRLATPLDTMIDAKVAPFAIQLPDYIF